MEWTDWNSKYAHVFTDVTCFFVLLLLLLLFFYPFQIIPGQFRGDRLKFRTPNNIQQYKVERLRGRWRLYKDILYVTLSEYGERKKALRMCERIEKKINQRIPFERSARWLQSSELSQVSLAASRVYITNMRTYIKNMRKKIDATFAS